MKHWTPSADSQLAGIDPAAAPSALAPATAPATAPERAQSTALVPVRHDGWTSPKQANFLRVLAATGNVALAAREVGMTRQSAYKLRARLKNEPFDHAWEAAFGTGYDRLAEAALARAINGTEVPHYHQGELVGTHRRYDERLALGLLALRPGASRRPKLPRVALDYVGDLGLLIDRVAHGPESWAEEQHEIAIATDHGCDANGCGGEGLDRDDWARDGRDREDWDGDGELAAANTPGLISPAALEAAKRRNRRRIGVTLPGDNDHDEEDAEYERAFQAALAAAQHDSDCDDDDEDSEEENGDSGGEDSGANPPQTVNRTPNPKNPSGPRITGL